MKFCSQCGSPVGLKVPTGDNRERFVCESCAHIHYQNPRIIAGYLPCYEDKILLCKRAIQPRYGYWTLPAGFLENHETVGDGALRESYEEARANIAPGELFAMFSLPHISQVYLFFRGQLRDLNFEPGDETLEVRLFSESDIPWQELAFPCINKAIEYYFEDLAKDSFGVHTEDLIFSPKTMKV